MATFADLINQKTNKKRTFADVIDTKTVEGVFKPREVVEQPKQVVSPPSNLPGVTTELPKFPVTPIRRTEIPSTPQGTITDQLKPFTDRGIEINTQKREERQKLDDLQEQIRKITLEGGSNPTEAQVNQVRALSKQFMEQQAKVRPTGLGIADELKLPFTPSISDVSKDLFKASPKVIEEAKQTPEYKGGRLGANILKNVALYSTIGGAVEGAIAAKGLNLGKASQFGLKQLGANVADLVLQRPQEILRNIDNGRPWYEGLADATKLDAVINLGIGAAGEAFNALKKIPNEEVAKQIDPKVAAEIRGTLSPQVDVPLSPSTRTFELPQANKQIDDFQKWRSDNFGGATGKQSLEDIQAIRDLYFEDTAKYLSDADLQPFVKDAVAPFEQPTLLKDTFETPGYQQATVGSVDKPRTFADLIDTQAKRIDDLQGDLKTAEDLMGSPRQSQFETPLTGRQRVGQFFETARGSDSTTAELRQRIKDLEIGVTSNEARTELAKQIVDKDFDTAIRMVKEGDQFGSAIESEIGRDLVTKLQQQGRNAEAVEVIEALAKKFNRAGKDVQAASIWSKTSPEGMSKWATKTLNEANVKVDSDLIAEVADDMRILQDMTSEELANRVSKKIGIENNFMNNLILNSQSFDELKALNTQITMSKVLDKIPKVQARKLSTIQAMSHLLNGRTFVRNILGNSASMVGEMVSNIPASVVDRGLSVFTGNRSVVASMPKWKQSLNNGLTQSKKSVVDILSDVKRGKAGKYDIELQSAFKSKPFKVLEKVMGFSLQTTDEFFKGFKSADSMYNQVRARLGKQVDDWDLEKIYKNATEEEIQQALDEAAFATFQNDSALADYLSTIKSTLNRVHIDPTKKFMKEVGDFGLGDLVIKYTRVPGNIITRGFEYSPLGYRKAAPYILDLLGGAEKLKGLSSSQQRNLALQLGRATTGTGLMYLGAKLYDEGIITGAEDSTDYDVQAFDRLEGTGDYRVNFSALMRFAKGEDTAPQEGDVMKTYNWAQPMTTPIAVGARLQSEAPESFFDAVSKSAGATWEESMDIPSLFIIKKMFYESMGENADFKDVLAVPIEEAIPGFIPSVARQIAQTIDPVIRDTSQGDQMVNRIKANIPGLSQTLPPKLDPLGQEQRRAEGLFPNLLDPATTSIARPTEFGEELRTIRDITGKTSIFPDRKPPTSFTLNGKKSELTPEEQLEWQRIEGQYVAERFEEILKDVVIDETNALRYATILENIKKQGGAIAKQQILQNRRE